MADALKAMTAFGLREPKQVKISTLSINELTDVALASVAARKGRMADLARTAAAAGLPLPGASTHAPGDPYSTFWVAPEMWLVEAPFASHELIADMLRARKAAGIIDESQYDSIETDADDDLVASNNDDAPEAAPETAPQEEER